MIFFFDLYVGERHFIFDFFWFFSWLLSALSAVLSGILVNSKRILMMDWMLEVVEGHLVLWWLFLHLGSSSALILPACWNVWYFELLLLFGHIQLLVLLHLLQVPTFYSLQHLGSLRIWLNEWWSLCHCGYGIFLHLALFGYPRLKQQIGDKFWLFLFLCGLASVLLPALKDWNQCWIYVLDHSLCWCFSIWLPFLSGLRRCRLWFAHFCAVSECDDARVLRPLSLSCWEYIDILPTLSIKSILIAESPIYCQLYTPIFARPMSFFACLLRIHPSTSSFLWTGPVRVAFSLPHWVLVRQLSCCLITLCIILWAMKLLCCLNSFRHINDIDLLTLLAAPLAPLSPSFTITTMLEFLNLVDVQWTNINPGIQWLFLVRRFAHPCLQSILEIRVHDHLSYLVVLEYLALDGSDSFFGLLRAIVVIMRQGARSWGCVVVGLTFSVLDRVLWCGVCDQGLKSEAVAGRAYDLGWWTQLWTKGVTASAVISSCASQAIVKSFRILNWDVLPSRLGWVLADSFHLIIHFRWGLILESLCIARMRTELWSDSFWRLAINGDLLPCCLRGISNTLSSQIGIAVWFSWWSSVSRLSGILGPCARCVELVGLWFGYSFG